MLSAAVFFFEVTTDVFKSAYLPHARPN